MDTPSSPSSMSARQFAVNIVKALKGDTVQDVQLRDYSLMKEMRWTWHELVSTPLHVILSISFINGRKAAYDNLQMLKEKEKGKK